MTDNSLKSELFSLQRDLYFNEIKVRSQKNATPAVEFHSLFREGSLSEPEKFHLWSWTEGWPHSQHPSFLWFSILVFLCSHEFPIPLYRGVLTHLFCDWIHTRALDLWEESAKRRHRLQWVRAKLCSVYSFLKLFLLMYRFFLHFQVLWVLLFLGVQGLPSLKGVLSCQGCLTHQWQEEASFFLHRPQAPHEFLP